MKKILLDSHFIITLVLIMGFCLAGSRMAVQPVRAGNTIQGNTIQVTTTSDELNSDGDCSLREAVRAANLNSVVDQCSAGSDLEADTIVLGTGTYDLTRTGSGEDEAVTGDLDISGELTIVGSGVIGTIIDGNGLDRIFQIVQTVNVQFFNMTFRNGNATTGDIFGGGAILNGVTDAIAGTVQIVNCVFTDNQADNTGGGLQNTGEAVLTNVTFENNSASNGGGIFNEGVLLLKDITLTQNSALETGGAIDNHNTATMSNLTISANSAVEGGGIFNDGQITMFNSTIAENTSGVENRGILRIKNTIIANSTSGDNCSGTGVYISEGHNLDSLDTCPFESFGDLTNADPLLGPLQDNQGPTLTHALLEGSPAIDSADNIDCPVQDQRGAYRPADGDENNTKVCDIGAVEFNGLFPFLTVLPVVARH